MHKRTRSHTKSSVATEEAVQPPKKKIRLAKQFLCTDALISIFQNFDVQDLVVLQLVCKQFQEVLLSTHRCWETALFTSNWHIPEQFHSLMRRLNQRLPSKVLLHGATNLKFVFTDEFAILRSCCQSLTEIDATVPAMDGDLSFPLVRKLRLRECSHCNFGLFPALDKLRLYGCIINASEFLFHCKAISLHLYSCQVKGKLLKIDLPNLTKLVLDSGQYADIIPIDSQFEIVKTSTPQSLTSRNVPFLHTLTLSVVHVPVDTLFLHTNLSQLNFDHCKNVQGSKPLKRGMSIRARYCDFKPSSLLECVANLSISEQIMTWEVFNEWMLYIRTKMVLLVKSSLILQNLSGSLPSLCNYPPEVCHVEIKQHPGKVLESCAAYLVSHNATSSTFSNESARTLLPIIAFDILDKRFGHVPESTLLHWKKQAQLIL